MTFRGPKAVGLIVAAVAVLALVALLEITDSSAFYGWQQKRMVKCVLAADPEQLLSAGRQLLHSRAGFVGEISPSAPEIATAIRRLKPTRVSILTNSVWVDFSDVSNPFGIAVYAAGAEGKGPHKWIDGLWLYDDGQLEGIGQPHGSANRSQRVSPGTNRTPPAAASGRSP
jgi:hypothetical protein